MLYPFRSGIFPMFDTEEARDIWPGDFCAGL